MGRMGVTSSEHWAAWRLARMYGPRIARLDRGSRVSWAEQMLDAIAENLKIDHHDHANECEECQRQELCFWRPPDFQERIEVMAELKTAIALERKDQEYAERAKLYGVDYRDHIDGFCSYWQNLRQRKFLVVNYACERCGGTDKSLQCHHLHYRTL